MEQGLHPCSYPIIAAGRRSRRKHQKESPKTSFISDDNHKFTTCHDHAQEDNCSEDRSSRYNILIGIRKQRVLVTH